MTSSTMPINDIIRYKCSLIPIDHLRWYKIKTKRNQENTPRGQQVKVIYETISQNFVNVALIFSFRNKYVWNNDKQLSDALIHFLNFNKKQIKHQIQFSPIHNKSPSNTLEINLQNTSYFPPATFFQTK